MPKKENELLNKISEYRKQAIKEIFEKSTAEFFKESNLEIPKKAMQVVQKLLLLEFMKGFKLGVTLSGEAVTGLLKKDA